nr:Chain A, GLN-ALA-PRO-ALA-TYR-LYS-LYS-ALA-ALA-LYS-LYS-LEU-ALA-GLU-SER [synthetic construct]1DN3_A Chain A, HUMAN PLATELET FACTOR 4, SEGMENT 59-73 [Homo sapiens]
QAPAYKKAAKKLAES